jgi:hypothetical protein
MKKTFTLFEVGKQRGFVALFTVLIAAVVLAMAVGIANISLKQIVLSGSATDANKSFYAADSGIECALFNDLRINAFLNGATEVDCGGVLRPVTSVVSNIFTFELEYDDGLYLSCAKVTVDKSDNFTNVTRVASRGTNNACADASPRTVERVIEVTY